MKRIITTALVTLVAVYGYSQTYLPLAGGTLTNGAKISVTSPYGAFDAITPTNFGYSVGYPVLMLGSHSGNKSIAFNVDISANPSGSFAGNGSEYIWRNTGSFIAPNATNNGYNTLFSWLGDGRVNIENTLTVKGSIIGQAGTYLDIYTNTSDASDNKITRIGGGGDVSSNRGAFATFYGNESPGYSGDLHLTPGAGGNMIVPSGNVGIGTTNTQGYKLAVAGKIHAIEVQIEALPWSDYVFHSSYKLPDLKDTEQFIKENKHLPEIPSAAEVEKNGIKLGEMNAKLLQKIEELTLYLIEQSKDNKAQANQIATLQQEVKQLKDAK